MEKLGRKELWTGKDERKETRRMSKELRAEKTLSPATAPKNVVAEIV